jgi:hypothetical protein
MSVGNWQADGDLFLGSNVSAAATTGLIVFAVAQNYNGEATITAGDVLFGDNSADKANMLWDKSAGTLLFRGGTTMQVSVDTTGALLAGGGKVTLDAAGITLVDNAGIIYYGATTFIHILASSGVGGQENIFFGTSAGNRTMTAAAIVNIGIGTNALNDNTTGKYNTAVGTNSLLKSTEGDANVAVGLESLSANTTGSNNVAIGRSALTRVTTGSSNVALGFAAGAYETGSNKLFIDNDTRSSEADGRIKALIYGVFAAASADQRLTFNAGIVSVNGGLHVGGTSDPGAGNILLTGNITLADGKTIGQAAGPLLTFDDTNNYLEITGCNVGIGTAAPGVKLDIVDSTAGDSVVLKIGSSGTVGEIGKSRGIAIYGEPTDAITLVELTKLYSVWAGGGGDVTSRRFTITNPADGTDLLSLRTGNVGIGTTSPGYMLDLKQKDWAGDIAQLQLQYANYGYILGGGLKQSEGAYFSLTENNDGTLTERVRVDTNGNVGIGTTGPTALLDVNSNILRLRTAKTPTHTGAGNVGDICWDSSYIYVCYEANHWLRAPWGAHW